MSWRDILGGPFVDQYSQKKAGILTDNYWFDGKMFYKIINGLSDVAIPEDVGDFRLMDRAVVEVLRSLPESKRFMKGLFAWAGFRTTTVDYVRVSRTAG
jgi:hypothetical protein